MIYQRKDHEVRAELLADHDNVVLIRAYWPAARDHPKYSPAHGYAVNILNLNRDDFHSRYDELSTS
jgi:hypothetical protein